MESKALFDEVVEKLATVTESQNERVFIKMATGLLQNDNNMTVSQWS